MISNRNIERIKVGDLQFDAISQETLLEVFQKSIGKSNPLLIYTPNLQFHRESRLDPEVSALLNHADILVCDSRFLQQLAKIGSSIKLERITGASILEWVLSLSIGTEFSLAVIGGQREAQVALRKRLHLEFDGRVKATFTDRIFSASPTKDDVDFALRFIEEAKADFVIYALGFPKQERLAWEMRRRDVPGVHLCIGAAIDYSSGVRRRSPKFIQYIGFEWLWRLLNEPIRLFRRYILQGIPEALRLVIRSIRG